jgi:hypothetical protein
VTVGGGSGYVLCKPDWGNMNSRLATDIARLVDASLHPVSAPGRLPLRARLGEHERHAEDRALARARAIGQAEALELRGAEALDRAPERLEQRVDPARPSARDKPGRKEPHAGAVMLRSFASTAVSTA